MRKTLCASVFVLALCGSALAGDMSNPPLARGDMTGPVDASELSSTQATGGWSGTGEASTEGDGIILVDDVDGLTAAALTVLNSMLALF